MESLFWADQIARKILKEFPKEKIYTSAAGITPSGTIHIGNFREIITVDLIDRALKDLGKKTRFIYSWDDYDRLRKIPKNVPDPEILKPFMFKPGVSAPDPWGCHKSYVEHFEKKVEESLPKVGIKPEFIYQSKMYKKCTYSEDIKESLQKKDKIRVVLNKFRKEPLSKKWWPLGIYCEKCGRDKVKVKDYDGEYTVKYYCECGHEGSIDFRKNGSVKLPWRVDWPMRWRYENVNCEGGGKDHSAPGGSLDTGHEICSKIFNQKPPVRFMYDFITIKNTGGKMSSSIGDVVTLDDMLEIYIPEIVRFIFAGTKPVKEFAISFDEDVIKVYEDFYKVERIYYGEESSKKEHWSRVYEMSCVTKPSKKIPSQPSFRRAITLINIYNDVDKALDSIGSSKRNKEVLTAAKNWLEKYAPEKYKFSLDNGGWDKAKLSKKQEHSLIELSKELSKNIKEDELVGIFKTISENNGITMKEFFNGVYTVLFGKDSGPRLSQFIMAVGKEKIAKILKK